MDGELKYFVDSLMKYFRDDCHTRIFSLSLKVECINRNEFLQKSFYLKSYKKKYIWQNIEFLHQPDDEVESFLSTFLVLIFVTFFFLSDESTTLAKVGDSSVMTISSLCQCMVSILAKHLARSWPETPLLTPSLWIKCFGFRRRDNNDLEVCNLVSGDTMILFLTIELLSIWKY